ncbi:Outer membrane protein OmpA [Aquiflexum balticum DSM 16537]|uniref:Outer membrane protein OmpA n=1 Tax=Aquiflexum balticum DSM 16537 TaxID=758820 RepID=A0A1W2H7X9_9BACT|nr:OmpA family protein [Aquiflexum balticum]SMD44949.1 Outer membrane protein OmpA [Aquiflexum balticum DSM 16537]
MTLTLKRISKMDQIKRNFLLVIVLAMAGGLVHLPLQAQNSLLRFAEKQYALENYSQAATLYSQAYERKAKYSTAVLAAESFQNLQDYENSFKWWKTVVSHEESTREDYLKYLKAAMKFEVDPNVQELFAGSPYSEFDFPEIDFNQLKELKKKQANVKLVPLSDLNSQGSDYGITADTLDNKYFSSNRGSSFESNKPGVRLDAKNSLFSEEKSDFNDMEYFGIYRFSTAGDISKISSDIADALQYSDPSLMESRNILFYTVFRNVRKIKNRLDFSVHPEIYFSNISTNGQFTDSKPFPINNITEYGVMTPFVDEEAKRIYYASDKPGGFGGFDLYYVTYDDQLNFGEPVNLGPDINTDKDETHPSRMGSNFYFSSKGHLGLGGMDIFISDYQNGNLGKVTNMGLPFNSSRDDFAFYISPNGKRYLSSDRVGGMGMDDIYLIEDLNKRLIARVIDCDGNVITEEFESKITERNTSNPIPTSRNEKSELTAELSLDTDFSLSISKKGFFNIQDNTLSTKGFDGEILEREYRLAPIPYNLPIYADIVYYDLDKSIIRPDAEPTLDKIGGLMQRYGFIDLLVNSHTDARASKEYNDILSQKRADAVSEYLSKYDIPKERVRLEWFGEEKIINDCGDGIPCPETEHQLNRRSELVLEAFSDKNRQYDLPTEFMGRDICDPIDLFEAMNHEIPTIYFDFDKASLRNIHKKELERVSLMLQRLVNLQLNITGHTDQRGNETYNMNLSERRAKAVMDYLINKGIEPGRMKSEWLGKTQPVNDCNTGDCNEAMHQLNRRTELKLQNNK